MLTLFGVFIKAGYAYLIFYKPRRVFVFLRGGKEYNKTA